MSKVFIDTLGCPKNFDDSERIAGLLEKSGHVIVSDPQSADHIIVNTCSFINDAKRESIGRIFELSALSGKLIVTGCLPQRYGKELFEEIPEADIFLGVNDYGKLPDLLKSQGRLINIDGEPCIMTNKRKRLGSGHTAYLKLSEGCDNNCTYCVIPAIRGGYRQIDQDILIKEASELAENGVRELILIAQDVTEYKGLPELIKKLANIEKLKWIRLMYCYEDRITDELIDIIKNEPKVCKYVDMPLQHISDKILKRMNRRSTRQSIINTVRKLRAAIPEIAIRTTLLVGFPGETEEDFEELYNFVEEMRFDRLGVFAYSKEEGTAAADMNDQVDDEVKASRQESVMQLQLDISRELNEEKVGRKLEVLVDRMEMDAYIGRTESDAPEIDEEVIFTDKHGVNVGDFKTVKITEALDYDLIGTGE